MFTLEELNKQGTPEYVHYEIYKVAYAGPTVSNTDSKFPKKIKDDIIPKAWDKRKILWKRQEDLREVLKEH